MTPEIMAWYHAREAWGRGGRIGPEPRYPQRRLGPLQEDEDGEGVPYTYQEYKGDDE